MFEIQETTTTEPSTELERAAAVIRDAFHYDPGHSDLDNEQPIHISTTLGAWRRLNHALADAGWIPVSWRLPDDEVTVMIALRDDGEPVWLGWHDEHGWHSADAGPLGDKVTHWRPMLAGPLQQPRVEGIE